MDIGKMNERITFEKCVAVKDKVGNHVTTWEEYYSCFAYASTYQAEENPGEVTTEERSISFSVRYCSELRDVSSTRYRIRFHDEIYNIRSVDMMNYQRREIKLLCRREVRQ